jgi:hypothetical protein
MADETPAAHAQPNRPRSAAGYLEAISRGVFSAGMSRRVVDAKWEGLKEAFLGFDPERVASMRPADVGRLAKDKRVVRNRPKIEATIENARTVVDLTDEFGSIRRYLASLGDFESRVRDLIQRFKFVGELGAYHFLWMVGEPVPEWGSWHGLPDRRPTKRRAKQAQARPRSARRPGPSGRDLLLQDDPGDPPPGRGVVRDHRPSERVSQVESQESKGAKALGGRDRRGHALRDGHQGLRQGHERTSGRRAESAGAGGPPSSRMLEGGHRWIFTDLGTGTNRIDHELELRPKGVFKLMGPMLRANGKKTVQQTAHALERHLVV